VFYPEASNIVVFVIMAMVLIVRPAGLFGSLNVRCAPAAIGFLGMLALIVPCARSVSIRCSDEAAVLRAVRLRLQPAARLRRHAVVRPRGFFGMGGLCRPWLDRARSGGTSTPRSRSLAGRRDRAALGCAS
jgi:hypothetical protein